MKKKQGVNKVGEGTGETRCGGV